MPNQQTNYKWYILILVVLTNMLLVAIPSMGMSVLSKEISGDLGLNLVQVGIIWGIGSLPGIVTGLLGGAIGDKIGPKRILIVASLLAGLIGAARGMAGDFISMLIITLLFGALLPILTMNGLKTVGQWFPARQLGLANGLISMGMAFGFLLGSLLSASILSPLLGGWRNVFIVYGLAGALLCIPWFFTRTMPLHEHATSKRFSIRQAVTHIGGQRNIWLLGLTVFGVGGCIQGILGYIPLYLRGLGWGALQADGVVSAFHTSSMIFVLPIALWSDRLGTRKNLLFLAALSVALGTGLLSIASGSLVWFGVLMAGFVRDAFMAIFMTMVIEVEGIGPQYAGTATGFAMAISGLGNFISPPLGNSLAGFWPGAPFLCWAGLAFFGMVCLSLVNNKQHVPADLIEKAIENQVKR